MISAKPDAHIEDATFPVGPKGAVRVRIVRPKDSERLVPVIMHFHGGGWVLGDRPRGDMRTYIERTVPGAIEGNYYSVKGFLLEVATEMRNRLLPWTQ